MLGADEEVPVIVGPYWDEEEGCSWGWSICGPSAVVCLEVFVCVGGVVEGLCGEVCCRCVSGRVMG